MAFRPSRLRGAVQPLALSLILAAAPALSPGAVRALELRGATVFERAPWRVDLVAYNTTVGYPLPAYYFTIELEAGAGASLGSLRLRQIRGVDRQFPFLSRRTEAFLGRPRREGRSVPVKSEFDAQSRTITVEFPEPVPPGSTVTVKLVPWTNPMQSDTYLFAAEVLPAGPNPQASPAGVATLRIYENTYW
jgi:hypothetical protein